MKGIKIGIIGVCVSLLGIAFAMNNVVQITYTSDNGDGVYGFEFTKDSYGNWEILQQGEDVTIDNLVK